MANEVRSNIFQSKKKLRVVIRDHFPDEDFDTTDLLAQLDPSEQNEKDIVNAVTSDSNKRVEVPEFERLPNNYDAFRSGAFFDAPHRCFKYDEDYFEPITYFADEQDYQFIQNFNEHHKFLRMRASDLEKVFDVCEEFMKDSLTDPPTLSQVMYILGENAPAREIVQAIHEHWVSRPKLGGSIMRYLEFPPDHCQLRQRLFQWFRNCNKCKKGLGDRNYIEALLGLLEANNEACIRAEDLLEEQKRKQIEDEKFVRQRQRIMEKRVPSCPTMICQAPIGGHNPVAAPPSEDVTKNTLPKPLTDPAFLKWCSKRKQ